VSFFLIQARKKFILMALQGGSLTMSTCKVATVVIYQLLLNLAALIILIVVTSGGQNFLSDYNFCAIVTMYFRKSETLDDVVCLFTHAVNHRNVTS